MSTFPDFATLPFDGAPVVTEAPAAEAWSTPEGIAVRLGAGGGGGHVRHRHPVRHRGARAGRR